MIRYFLFIFFFFVFSSNSFGFITFKQSKDISSDATGLRQINFKPDGTIMYVTNREKNTVSEVDSVIQYSLSTPFDISTATLTSSTTLTNIDKPHAIHFKPDGKVIARENTKIFSSDNNEIGFVTSGTFGPSVNAPVAMGYVKSEFSEIGTSIQLEVRGKKYGGKISELPFYKKSYVK